jgi:hypothetical protein
VKEADPEEENRRESGGDCGKTKRRKTIRDGAKRNRAC